MIAPMAATTSIWEKGRRYLIMMLAPVEGLSEGCSIFAARNGLKTVAVIKLDGLVANAAANGASELARTKGCSWSSPRHTRMAPPIFPAF